MNCFWSGLTPQDYVYCERQLCGIIQQPANTWSNIGYFIVSVLILRTRLPKSERIFFAAAVFILFLFSGFFHLTGSHTGKVLDVGAMFILSMGICSYSLQRWLKFSQRIFYSVFFTGLLVSIAFLIIMGFGNVLFVTELAIAVYAEVQLFQQGRPSYDKRLFISSLFSFFTASIFLVLDLTRTWCEPENHFVNGHAMWHIFAAISIYLVIVARRAPHVT